MIGSVQFWPTSVMNNSASRQYHLHSNKMTNVPLHTLKQTALN